ncbi:hypothetical protein SK128_025673 [Halocaridina rubra]|uniref:C2H2-type domain-containing protein n=1 Tax=Halocaridina rubra TaxID=373956 RepID=A0AAN8X7A8_HALRR
MEQSQNATSMVWYNYSPVDGIITSGNAPVQVELGAVDIARQINQQVTGQYGILQAVPAQPQHIIVSQHPQHPPASTTPELVINPKPPKPRKASNADRVPCNECGKTFSCNANLRDHLRLHSGERPFKCSECDMAFAQRSNWRLHKRVHTGERPYMCGICGKTFSRSSHLPGHMRIHTGERPFTCDRCEHSFASHQALKNHSRTHTGEKPFICEFCHTAFTHSSSLSSHKKRCTGEKRKRGRPLGSGRNIVKKKSTGRPRGRPRKKGRYAGRRKRKLTAPTNAVEKKIVKSEIDYHDEEICPDISHTIEAKEELEDIPTVEVDPDTILLETDDPLETDEETKNLISEEQDPIKTDTLIMHHQMVPVEEVVSAAAAAAALDETTSLHQEAAVAMAALHEGAALNLAHHQLPQENYVERDVSHTMWYPKQQQY